MLFKIKNIIKKLTRLKLKQDDIINICLLLKFS